MIVGEECNISEIGLILYCKSYDLAGAGLLPKVGELEQDARKEIKKSAGLLMPYGISENDIARLHEEALRKGS